MKNKFTKNYVYLVKSTNGLWYIVRQQGQRTWVAFNFTHGVESQAVSMVGNAIKLMEDLTVVDIRNYHVNNLARFRKETMDILMYGEIR